MKSRGAAKNREPTSFATSGLDSDRSYQFLAPQRLISNAKLIGSELVAAKVKSVASVETYIEKGALMGVVADYLELGKVAAAIVHRHQQGTNLREIPVQAAKQPQLLVNKTTRKALNVNLPEAILKQAVIVE